MSTPVAPLMQRPAWTLLQAHHQAIAPLHLRKLFAEDPDRGRIARPMPSFGGFGASSDNASPAATSAALILKE